MARKAAGAVKTRLNLLIGPDTRQRLERLAESTEADSMTEVIRRALRVYEKLVDEEMRDGVVLVKSVDGTERQLVVLS